MDTYELLDKRIEVLYNQARNPKHKDMCKRYLTLIHKKYPFTGGCFGIGEKAAFFRNAIDYQYEHGYWNDLELPE